MRYYVLLILSILSLSGMSQVNRPDFKKAETFRRAVLSSSALQANNRGFVRLAQYGNNNKARIRTKGSNIDVDASQKGEDNLLDFDIYGNNTYNYIHQSGKGNTLKGKCTLYNNDLSLKQQGRNNLIEFRNNKIIPGLRVSQRGKGVKVIFY